MCIHPNDQSPFSAVRAISAVLRTRADLWGEFASIRGRANDNGAWSQWVVALSVLDDWGPVVRRAIAERAAGNKGPQIYLTSARPCVPNTSRGQLFCAPVVARNLDRSMQWGAAGSGNPYER